MPDLITTARAVSLILQREDARRGLGWTAAAILSPVILFAALLCCLTAGAEHNAATADLCFLGGPMPEGADSAYIQNITDMRESFTRLDEALEQVQGLTASGSGLDAISVKAAFFVLCFGGADLPPTAEEAEAFVDCFLRYETTTEVQWDEDVGAVLVEVVTAAPLPLSGAYDALEEAGASGGDAGTQRTDALSYVQKTKSGSAPPGPSRHVIQIHTLFFPAQG